MVNNTRTWLWCGLLGLALVGCQGGSAPTAPASEGDLATKPARLPGTVALGSPQMQGDASLIPAAMWDVTIDVATLTASVGKRPDERTGQTYAETYLMDVTRYFTPSVMEIEGVTRTATDRLKVDYTIAHPFPAATNPDGPATATNRADLGITGIVMFPLDVVDENPIVYFAESERPIIANTDAIATPDGYYVPAGLVYGLDMQANCFPFRRLVNDARRESRIGIPLVNLGVGNFDPDFGWQRSNWGPTQTGWTGYGALHQGQVARNSVELNLPPAPTTSISLPVMLIAKYLDPVGPGTGPADRAANRLPSADGDRTKFLYRMPQAAWDLERVEVHLEGAFSGTEDSQLTLAMRITDADVFADDVGNYGLAPEQRANRIIKDENGAPEFSVDIPTLRGITPLPGSSTRMSLGMIEHDDRAVGGDIEQDLGTAEDPLYVRFLHLERSDNVAYVTGMHTGMVRVMDASEPGQDIQGVSPWLAPLTSDIPLAATYQTFEAPVVSLPILNFSEVWPDAEIESADYFAVRFSTDIRYLWAAPWLEFDWNGDGDWEDPDEDIRHVLTDEQQTRNWPKPVNNPGLEPLLRQVNLRAHFQDQVEVTTLQFTVGPNHPPQVQPHDYFLNAQRLIAPATFQLIGMYATDPEGDHLAYAIATPEFPGITESSELPLTFPGSPLSYPSHRFTRYSIYVTDAAHRGTSGTFVRSQVLRVDSAPRAGWAYPLPDYSFQSVHVLTYDQQGMLYVVCLPKLPWGFDDANFVVGELAIFSLDPLGEVRWATVLRNPAAFSPVLSCDGAVVRPDGQLVLAGHRSRDIDFGGGMRTGAGLSLLTLDSTDGSYITDTSWDNADHFFAPVLFLRPDGDYVLLGSIGNGGSSVVTFGGPERTLVGSSIAFAMQLSPSGAFEWDYAATGGRSSIMASGIDAEGTCYLAGVHEGAVDYGAGLEIAGRDSGLILALTSQGEYRWVKVLEEAHGGYAWVDAIAGSQTGPGCLASGYAYTRLYLNGATESLCNGGFWVQYDSDGTWLSQQLETGSTTDLLSLADGGWLIGGNRSSTRFLARTDAQFNRRWESQWIGGGSTNTLELLAVSPTGQIAMTALGTNFADHDPGPAEYFSRQDDEAIITVSSETGQW